MCLRSCADRLSVERHRVAYGDRARLEHPSVDPERQRVRGLDLAPVAREDVEGGQIDLARVGIAAGDQTAAHVAAPGDTRAANAHPAPDPPILVMSGHSVDL